MIRNLFFSAFNHFRQRLIVSPLILVYPFFVLFIFGCQIGKKEPPLIVGQDHHIESSYYEKCQPFNTNYIQDNVTITKPWRIAYLFKTKSNPFWQKMNQELEEVSDQLGIQSIVKFTEENPSMLGNVKKQINLVIELIESKNIDGLIIAPEDSIQLVPIIEKATNTGIPVIVIDTPIDTDKILTFVTFDNFQGSKMLGEWVMTKIQNSSITDQKINILILEGSLHEENTIERRQGFLAGLKTANNNYGLDLLDFKSAEWKTQKAKSITQNWLENFSKIDVIMAADDQMALGASQAVTEANRMGIIITGFDGTPFGLNAIKTGKFHATIDQIPKTQINLITQLMISYLENRVTTFPPCQLIGKEHKKTDILITSDDFKELKKDEYK